MKASSVGGQESYNTIRVRCTCVRMNAKKISRIQKYILDHNTNQETCNK